MFHNIIIPFILIYFTLFSHQKYGFIFAKYSDTLLLRSLDTLYTSFFVIWLFQSDGFPERNTHIILLKIHMNLTNMLWQNVVMMQTTVAPFTNMV